MPNAVVITKGRTNIITANLGVDVSTDVLTGEIRASDSPTSELLGEWTITKDNGGADGLVTLTLDDSAITAAGLLATDGFMDIKRVRAGEPLNVFREPIPVKLKNRVTV